MSVELERTEELLKNKTSRFKILTPVVLVIVVALVAGGFLGIRAYGHKAYKDSIALGDKFMQEGNYEEAVTAYEKSVNIKKKDVPALEKLAAAYDKKGDEKKARETYDNLYEITKQEKFVKKKKRVGAERKQKSAYEKYVEFLEDNEGTLESENYHTGEDDLESYPARNTAICDIDGDGVEELFVVKYEGEGYEGKLMIGKIVKGELEFFEFDTPITGREQNKNNVIDIKAAGGSQYAVCIDADKGILTTFFEIRDEFNDKRITEYAIDGLALKMVGQVKKYDRMNEDYTKLITTYTINDEDVSKAEGEKTYKKYMDNSGNLILCQTYTGREGRYVEDESMGMVDKELIRELRQRISAKSYGSREKDGDKLTDDDRALFTELSKEPFVFSSGAGGWGTSMEVKKDGTFTGDYHDSNMGETGDGYSGGTVYSSSFSGRFTDVEQVGECEYTMSLAEEIEMEHELETTEIIDEVKYIYTDPYGMDGMQAEDRVTIYAPGFPIEDIPEDARSWLISFEETEEGPLSNYCIVNYNSRDGARLFYQYSDTR